jgi:hypothetical protein
LTTAWVLTVDKFGNIFTTGIFHGTADFDPGAGLYEVTSEGEGDVLHIENRHLY